MFYNMITTIYQSYRLTFTLLITKAEYTLNEFLRLQEKKWMEAINVFSSTYWSFGEYVEYDVDYVHIVAEFCVNDNFIRYG